MNIHNGADDVIESRNIRMDQSGLSIPKSLAISLLMLEPLLLEFVHFCAEKLFFRQEFMELFCTQTRQHCGCGVFSVKIMDRAFGVSSVMNVLFW